MIIQVCVGGGGGLDSFPLCPPLNPALGTTATDGVSKRDPSHESPNMVLSTRPRHLQKGLLPLSLHPFGLLPIWL